MEQKERMEERGTGIFTKTAEPRKYQVHILNDDFTTFEFVIHVVMTVFFKSEAEAETIAMTTHLSGRALVGVYSLDIAKSKVHKAVSMAREENFPLRFEISPEQK